jgi:hypothetical protein
VNKHLFVYVFVIMLVISGITCLTILSSEANGQGKEATIAQGNDPILNGTDYNATIGQFLPNFNITITPRIIIEYGDFAIKQDLTSPPPFPIPPRIITEYADAALQFAIEPPQGLNTTGVTPRIIIEYADYASFIAFPVQRYPKPLFIGTPIPPPPKYVNQSQQVTVSVNVTGIWSPVRNVSLSYTTSTNNASWPNPWNSVTMNLTKHYDANSTINLYQGIIPGQPAGTYVRYSISAYDDAGNYAQDDNVGQYYVYSVVPEFPSVIILPLLVITTLFAAIAYKKKRST